ncbi:hypothetical protein CVIRNUC_010272 [Coccomyxa viridis]|uniref:Uncharacterized protein n=1 Tax=Coccomyxa viridis TaxID=1274662 RepID=A0AAV1IK86_9CHLO|nr:hypothetical protein CVIRNUC_010272 [Coccomyxa viridis]
MTLIQIVMITSKALQDTKCMKPGLVPALYALLANIVGVTFPAAALTEWRAHTEERGRLSAATSRQG